MPFERRNEDDYTNSTVKTLNQPKMVKILCTCEKNLDLPNKIQCREGKCLKRMRQGTSDDDDEWFAAKETRYNLAIVIYTFIRFPRLTQSNSIWRRRNKYQNCCPFERNRIIEIMERKNIIEWETTQDAKCAIKAIVVLRDLFAASLDWMNDTIVLYHFQCLFFLIADTRMALSNYVIQTLSWWIRIFYIT